MTPEQVDKTLLNAKSEGYEEALNIAWSIWVITTDQKRTLENHNPYKENRK